MSKDIQERIERTNELMDRRKRGAAEVLKDRERSTWSFGIIGLSSEIDGVVSVGDMYIFRKVYNPPYGFELLAALRISIISRLLSDTAKASPMNLAQAP